MRNATTARLSFVTVPVYRATLPPLANREQVNVPDRFASAVMAIVCVVIRSVPPVVLQPVVLQPCSMPPVVRP